MYYSLMFDHGDASGDKVLNLERCKEIDESIHDYRVIEACYTTEIRALTIPGLCRGVREWSRREKSDIDEKADEFYEKIKAFADEEGCAIPRKRGPSTHSANYLINQGFAYLCFPGTSTVFDCRDYNISWDSMYNIILKARRDRQVPFDIHKVGKYQIRVTRKGLDDGHNL